MERSSSSDEEKLSVGDTHTLLDERVTSNAYWKGKKKRTSWVWVVLVVLNATILLANIFLIKMNLWSESPHMHDEVHLRTHDFTKDAIRMEIRSFDDTFNNDYNSKFRGNPRPELNAAWKSMIHGYNLRIPSTVWVPQATSNHTLVELADGSGDHYAVLAVLHELHCLKTIREYLIPDEYPDTYEIFKPDPGEKIGTHIDHCIDSLRQASMCHADMALLPLEWWDETDVPQNVIHTPHLCANWDQLQDWAVAHSFTPWGEGLLQKPT